jgi:hypothetical protein
MPSENFSQVFMAVILLHSWAVKLAELELVRRQRLKCSWVQPWNSCGLIQWLVFPLEKTGRTTHCEFVGGETFILVSMTSLKYLGSMPLKSIITYIGYLGLHQYFSHPLILNLHISNPIYKYESGTLKLWETINSKASGSIKQFDQSIVERDYAIRMD